MIVSFITDSEELEVVLDPERNCGTTGTASVLIGNTNKTNQKSLVNGNAYSCGTYATCTRSSSSTSVNT